MSLLLFNQAIPLHFPKYRVGWQCSQAHQRPGKWKSDNLKSEKNTNTIDLICMDFSTKITSWIEWPGCFCRAQDNERITVFLYPRWTAPCWAFFIITIWTKTNSQLKQLKFFVPHQNKRVSYFVKWEELTWYRLVHGSVQLHRSGLSPDTKLDQAYLTWSDWFNLIRFIPDTTNLIAMQNYLQLLFYCYLAVHNSSIGDLVPWLVGCLLWQR